MLVRHETESYSAAQTPCKLYGRRPSMAYNSTRIAQILKHSAQIPRPGTCPQSCTKLWSPQLSDTDCQPCVAQQSTASTQPKVSPNKFTLTTCSFARHVHVDTVCFFGDALGCALVADCGSSLLCCTYVPILVAACLGPGISMR